MANTNLVVACMSWLNEIEGDLENCIEKDVDCATWDNVFTAAEDSSEYQQEQGGEHGPAKPDPSAKPGITLEIS